MIYHISIPGKVKAKERPRKGKYGNFYTPKPTQDFEKLVHSCATQSGVQEFSKDDKVIIALFFYGQYGKSDLDNLIKSCLDGFKFFFNDRKVIEITAKKLPSPEYHTEITLESK